MGAFCYEGSFLHLFVGTTFLILKRFFRKHERILPQSARSNISNIGETRLRGRVQDFEAAYNLPKTKCKLILVVNA